ELSTEVSALLLVSLASAYGTVSGSIRSEYGKNIEDQYLQILFNSLSVKEVTTFSDSTTSPGDVLYISGRRWGCKDGVLQLLTGKKGREIDAMVFVKDTKSRAVPLIAIEFTVGGRGNPSAAVNKAKSLAKNFESCFDDGLVFFAYDLGDLRKDIDKSVRQIYFKDDKGDAPLEIIHEMLLSRAKNCDQDNIKLPSIEDAKNTFQDEIKSLKK
ncbi:MAG: hypothetical protein ACXAEF_13090, partial [Candidatus Thorarchaeota archaeon]